MLEVIGTGSFFRILEGYKSVDADLVEQVNQVRGYRNWVAHGRKGKMPPAVTPEVARDRLSRFLEVLGNRSPETDPDEPFSG